MGNKHASKKKIILDNQSEEIRFFWKGNYDPFNEPISEWIPFDMKDNELLEKSYQKFIKGINDKLIIGNYSYDFEKSTQFNIYNVRKQRPIKREITSNVTNILRKNRFREICISSNNNLMSIDNWKNLIDDVECEFNVIPKNTVKFKVKKNQNFFNGEININFITYIDLLTNEITELSIRFNQNDYYKNLYFDKITEFNFFSLILKMYTEESFLYGTVNKILRDGNPDDYQLIKYYYISLLASFEFCSKMDTNNTKLFVGARISHEEIKLFAESTNLIMRTDTFLSTTYNINTAKQFLPKEEEDGCLFEIEISNDIPDYNNLALMNDHSVYPTENEVLIKSGSLLFIKKFETKNKNYFCQIYLISNSLEGLKLFLETNTSLNKFDLSSYNLGETGGKYISNALAKNLALKEIDLSSNKLGEKGAKYISDYLAKNHKLHRINLSSNNLGEIGIMYIIDSISKNQTLKRIDLSSNNLGEKGAMYIINYLIKNYSLTTINLSSNYLGEIGAKYISDALIQNHSLTTMNLRNNNFGEKGSMYIFNYLIKNNSLTSIDLSSNNFREKGAKYISDAIAHNQTLTTIDLNSNNFGEKGARYIFEALKKNQILTAIDLSNNKIIEIEENFFLDFLTKNQTLNSIDLRNNNFLKREYFERILF